MQIRRLVLAHVGEQRAAVDVADRVQPVRAADPHPVVDLEIAVGLDARPSPARARPCAAAPDRDQQLVAAQLLAALELQRDLPALAARRADRLRPGAHLDAAALEPVGDLLARERLLAPRSAGRRLDQGDAGAEAAPRLGELHADDAAAEDQQPLGHATSPSSPRGWSTAAPRRARRSAGSRPSSRSR